MRLQSHHLLWGLPSSRQVGLRSGFGVLLVVALVTLGCTGKQEGPYDAAANPVLDFTRALAQATAERKHVLIIFGANWCPDCRAFAQEISTEPLAQLVREHFVVFHVNIGNWNANMDFAGRFGEPVAHGIPSIVITDTEGTPRYVTAAGELASVRSLTSMQLLEWFERVVAMLEQGFPERSENLHG